MSKFDFTGFDNRKCLKDILKIPPRVESVYSLTQHVWAGNNDSERQKSKKQNQTRLETLEEFFIDPVRNYLHRILESIADGKGQGFWVQAEFGVGKSHLLASTAILAVGGRPAWDKVKEREDEEKKAGPGARLDAIWRDRIQSKKIFPIVFSLEGCGGGLERKLEDFILEEAQSTFGLRLGKPLAIYPEEYLANLFLEEHHKNLKDDLRVFLSDPRLMRGLSQFDYDELISSLKDPEAQRDAGRVLMAFYRYKNLSPRIPTERGERLRRAFQDILEAGYEGIFIAIDEMSEYLRRSQFTGDDEDCLLALSSTLAKAEAMPVWVLVAAQAAHTNPKKIVGPDRLREELLEHKAERFRDIVVQRTRQITDKKEVALYHRGFAGFLPWVREASPDEFESTFPFPSDAIDILRSISTKLTGTRSTISFLHRALKSSAENREKDLVPLWKVFDDLMSYNETPSQSSSGAISIRSGFRDQVAALEAAQNTLKRITDGQLARPQNQTRAERILNTLFLYHIAGVSGLTLEQILDAVCDIKPGEETLEAQKGHYGTILEEMCSKLRNQIRRKNGHYEFIPKETSQYDDLVYEATERLKKDPQLFERYVDRLFYYSDPADKKGNSPFAPYAAAEDWQRVSFTIKDWHGQERSGRITVADLSKMSLTNVEVEGEDDFLVVFSRRPLAERAMGDLLRKGKEKPIDPRVAIWAPTEMNDAERMTLASIAAHLLVRDESGDSFIKKTASQEFRKDGFRAFTTLVDLYSRGTAKTSRTSLDTSNLGGVEGALTRMASAAMDTCYKSRDIDFGNRKFDTSGAVKLINGLVKLGQSVSEGDQLWSAVENFAPPLGLVRSEAPKRLDPEESSYYKSIRERILKHGRTGLEVKTVYNWFTGYHPDDGAESPGLTRRMVDVYLLCMARKGLTRISRKKGAWVDRNTIASIDFKPDVLRNLDRVDLPTPLDDWANFYRYLEALISCRPGSLGVVPEGSLGPAFDRAKADEALQILWRDCWIESSDIERIDRELNDFFGDLHQDNPFTELLIYWLTFAEEERPVPYADQEVYAAMCRSVLNVAGVSVGQDLEEGHFEVFRENFGGLSELRTSFNKTRELLLRAARMSSAPVPDSKPFKDIIKFQKSVLDELVSARELILSPDRVNTRLQPRLERLEKAYLPAYEHDLWDLDAVQKELGEAARKVETSDQLKALQDFSGDVQEAKKALDQCEKELREIPSRIWPSLDDRDAVIQEVTREAYIKANDKTPLTLMKIGEMKIERHSVLVSVKSAGERTLLKFSDFLLSPGVQAIISPDADKMPELSDIVGAKSNKDVHDALLTMPPEQRKTLAKYLKAVLGKKQPKPVYLTAFNPRNAVLFEEKEIETAVSEFRNYLNDQWQEGYYLKIEK